MREKPIPLLAVPAQTENSQAQLNSLAVIPRPVSIHQPQQVASAPIIQPTLPVSRFVTLNGRQFSSADFLTAGMALLQGLPNFAISNVQPNASVAAIENIPESDEDLHDADQDIPDSDGDSSEFESVLEPTVDV